MKTLPKIMYDQTQYTALWMLDTHGIWINDAIYSGMETISGYAPEGWITYTQNKPISFFFGAFPQETLEKESEEGFKNFSDQNFLNEFEYATKEAYKRTKEIKDEYFEDFYGREKICLEEDPRKVIVFMGKVHNLATYIMSYYLLTQPQRFYRFEKEIESFIPNATLELISTNGRHLTYISQLRRVILNAAHHNKEIPLEEIEKYGFLNWGVLGGDLITEETVKDEVTELISNKDKLTEEFEKIESLVKTIEQRNIIISENSNPEILYAEIIGHSSVLRFDLQTCMLCVLKYVDNFIQIAKEKNNLTKDHINSYCWDEILNLIENGVQLPQEIIEERQIGFLRVYRNNGSQTFIGENAKEEIKELLDFRKNEIDSSTHAKGTTASFGDMNIDVITGKAFVLTTSFGADELIKDFTDGDILIATQTHPNLVPIMKNALAIVTDEGGVTCHAAIVSRELQKPCIIGTRLATKIFKTGDMLEVNLAEGTVKKV